MNNYSIAILITTFLRDKLLYSTLQTILTNRPNDSIVLIADQGYTSEEKNIEIDFFKSQMPLEYFKLPFDCGLSYGRNFLVNKAKEMQIPFCLISADSIQFIEKYDFSPLLDIFNKSEQLGLVGFELKNSKCPWEFNIEIKKNNLIYQYSHDYKEIGNIKFLKVDICRNIFLAKTNSLESLWDEEMKLCEHTLAFLEYKKRGYDVYWTDKYSFKRTNTVVSDEYNSYRKRQNDYLKLLKAKLNIFNVLIPIKKGHSNANR